MRKTMGPWSLKELMAARAYGPLNVTPEELQRRHERYGGSVRLCLAVPAANAEATLAEATRGMDFASLSRLLRSSDNEPVRALNRGRGRGRGPLHLARAVLCAATSWSLLQACPCFDRPSGSTVSAAGPSSSVNNENCDVAVSRCSSAGPVGAELPPAARPHS